MDAGDGTARQETQRNPRGRGEREEGTGDRVRHDIKPLPL